MFAYCLDVQKDFQTFVLYYLFVVLPRQCDAQNAKQFGPEEL